MQTSRMSFLDIYAFIVLINYIIYLFIRFFIYNIEKRDLIEIYKYDEIVMIINKIIKEFGLPSVVLEKGRCFQCNINKLKIFIIKSEKYNIIKLFKCLHEVGHYIDSSKKRIFNVYKLSKLFIINRLIVLPLILGVFLCFIITNGIIVKKSYFIILILLYSIFAILRIIIIPITELKASRFAYNYMINNSYIHEKDTMNNRIRLFYNMCMIEQLAMAINWFLIIMLIFAIVICA